MSEWSQMNNKMIKQTSSKQMALKYYFVLMLMDTMLTQDKSEF